MARLPWECKALLVECEHGVCTCGVCVAGSPYLGEASKPCICFGGPLPPKQASPAFGGVHTGEGVCNHTQTPGCLGKSSSVGTFTPDPLDKETGYFAV